ncbi:hypothetical protein IT575_11550 [bacterium]|nr:hypothetical protein [bacterium]
MSANPYGDIPACLLIAICNDVIEDKRTNNKSLIGLFSNINVLSLPAAHPRLYLVLSLSNITGEVPLRVVLRNPQGGEAQFDNRVRADNSEVVLDMVMQLDNLALPVLGRYTFEVWSGDEFLAARSFNVSMVQAKQQGVAPGFPQSGEVGSA